MLDIPKYQPDISGQRRDSKKLEKSRKTAMFRPNPAKPNISRISDGYQGLLYTGYHDLSPVGENAKKVCIT